MAKRHNSPDATRASGMLNNDEEESMFDKKTTFKLPEISPRRWGGGQSNGEISPGEPEERYMAMNSKKWNPNSFVPTFLDTFEPLRYSPLNSVQKKHAVSLERIFDNDIWYPNRLNADYLVGR